jgi:septal ring factor EnvC (AmiA/AmiB activator)
MNEVEHFFDMEIEMAKKYIDAEAICFNGVVVGKEIANKLNQAHISFCTNAKLSLKNSVNEPECEFRVDVDQLRAENEQLKKTVDMYYEEKNEYQGKIKEMQSHIDCLKAELKEVQESTELPTAPIDVAKMLIEASKERETSRCERALGAPDKISYEIYSISDLRQIAEHLIVYCNANREEQHDII